jgi:hypothetical protein
MFPTFLLEGGDIDFVITEGNGVEMGEIVIVDRVFFNDLP